jgi:hypothetical protein
MKMNYRFALMWIAGTAIGAIVVTGLSVQVKPPV